MCKGSRVYVDMGYMHSGESKLFIRVGLSGYCAKVLKLVC